MHKDKAGSDRSGQGRDTNRVNRNRDTAGREGQGQMQGKRHKEWRMVCNESWNEPTLKSYVNGSPDALEVCWLMERNCSHPSGWLARFCHSKHLMENDRNYRECE